MNSEGENVPSVETGIRLTRSRFVTRASKTLLGAMGVGAAFSIAAPRARAQNCEFGTCTVYTCGCSPRLEQIDRCLSSTGVCNGEIYHHQCVNITCESRGGRELIARSAA